MSPEQLQRVNEWWESQNFLKKPLIYEPTRGWSRRSGLQGHDAWGPVATARPTSAARATDALTISTLPNVDQQLAAKVELHDGAGKEADPLLVRQYPAEVTGFEDTERDRDPDLFRELDHLVSLIEAEAVGRVHNGC
jgi:hypothetical protein